MIPEAPMRGNRRGPCRWLWILPLVLPVAALLLGNLWLACPPGRNWVAGKIHRRVGLETGVGRTSVWPWSGITLRDVEFMQPPALRPAVDSPLARITEVRISILWRSWLRGKPYLRELALDSPEFVVPIELLAELAKSQAPAAPAAPTAPTAPTAPPPVALATPPMVGPPAPLPTAPTAPPASPDRPPAAGKAAKPAPTAWLHLKNASFSVISASSGNPWLEISGIGGSIPIAGGAVNSPLKIRSVQVAGAQVLNHLNAALDWKSPLLSIQPLEMEVHGLKLMLAGKLGLLNGLPVQIEARIPRQALAALDLPADGRIQAESVAMNARFRGLLLAPGSWQGDLVAESQSPSATIAGQDAKFDRGSAVTVLRGGLLSCVDARLIGDDLSLLGNATLLADGRAAAVLRMVAAPESANAIARRLFPGNPQPPALTPLATPQRVAFDLEAFGNIRQPLLRLGNGGPIVELKR